MIEAWMELLQKNCRTCANSTPERDGTWHCEHWGATIPNLDAQLAGCDSHVIHPDLTAAGHHGVLK